MSDQLDFVHLHVHTEYSLLDGLSKIDKLVNRAQQLGMQSLAITDHGAMFGVIQFWRACDKVGIKPIIGMEAYLARQSMHIHDQSERQPFHLLLLAKDMTGYKNLLKIASASQFDGFYGKPRVDKDFLAAHSEGIICTSGCLAAEIPRLIVDGRENEAKQMIGTYLDIFGKENFYLELQDHDIPEIKVLNDWLIANRDYADIKMLATNDVHYVLESDASAQDTLLCIQTNTKVSDTKRMRMSDPSYHLRSQVEMWNIFGHIRDGEPLRTSLEIADMCNVNLSSKGYHLPVFPVPEGYTPETYLRYLADRGAHWRYGSQADGELIKTRLNYELSVIHQMGFDTYFLIVWDLCQYARKADIWWNVRGSGAGSVTAFCLGITNIDPIKNNLIFERFLNPGRVSMPDIDMDFPDDRRMDMIDYAMRKYGSDKVAAIITFGTMKARAAIKDVGRALGYSLPEVMSLTQLVPQIPSKPVTLSDCLGDNPDKAVPELRHLYDSDERIHTLLEAAKELEGVTRNAGTHAAGVIIGDKPLVEYLPLHRPLGETKVSQITQFPMEICESIGLLKVDFLGLSTLTIMRKACELIERYHGVRYTMANIPYLHKEEDDEYNAGLDKAFDLIGEGETTGIFQLEGAGMTRMLVEMKPRTFEHIIAAISLYRPGPMELIPTYIKRMHGEEDVVYHHPKLQPILEESYGICVSGDSLVIEAKTGKRYRVDELADKIDNFYIQGVDENYCPAIGRVAYWIDNGIKPVYRVTLRNGATIKTTIDHKFLTEDGWQELGNLQVGSYVAVPPQLVEPEQTIIIERRKLRVLAYLIADGSLASGSSVDFVNKDQRMIQEYVDCLEIFEDVVPTYTSQIHDVTRVGIRHKRGTRNVPTSLLLWMRELGMKYDYKIRKHPCGVRSQEKSIPEFVFSLNNEDLIFFLASLWDCDGYIGRKLCHYKTISKQLAYDVQTLLLRLGIASTIYVAVYSSSRGEREAYQVTLYDVEMFLELVKPYMLTEKRDVVCVGISHNNTIRRAQFIEEIKFRTGLSARALMLQYGIDRQHLNKVGRNRERISSHVVRGVAETIPLPQTLILTNTDWEEIVSIEPAGEEHVFDLTVEGLHNFVANNIMVHNCVYQEQIQQIAAQLFGYSLGDADLMRRAVSKKKAKDLALHKQTFMEQGPENGVSAEIAEKIFAEIEFFAAYGFNKSHAADYAVLTCQTAFLKAHYPEEYYTALLSVQRDVINDVKLYISDCRHFNIPVLPPDINSSELDFTIEPTGKGNQRGIRYGLGAIKNAGEKAVEYIIEERQRGGKFRDITDFLSRVDLRKVGKKPLESLVKVGALDSLIPERGAALLSIDRMHSFSGDHHKALEAGQMSLFGGVEEFILEKVSAEKAISQRDILRWEKDLIGLYVSEHPLNAVMDSIQHLANIQFSEHLKRSSDKFHEKSVTVAGLVAEIRKLTTKKNDQMAIVTIEDVEGLINVTLFPRTWTQYQSLIVEDRLIIVRGKCDSSRGDVQVIVESISQDLEIVRPADEPTAVQDESIGTDWPEMAAINYEDAPDWAVDKPATITAVSNGAEADIDADADIEAAHDMGEELIEEELAEEPVYETVTADGHAVEQVALGHAERPAYEFEIPDSPCLITITVVRTDDPDKDRRKLMRLQEHLISYPGSDYFRFRLVGLEKTIVVEFPEHSTSYAEVGEFLHDSMGANAIEIEPLESEA